MSDNDRHSRRDKDSYREDHRRGNDGYRGSSQRRRSDSSGSFERRSSGDREGGYRGGWREDNRRGGWRDDRDDRRGGRDSRGRGWRDDRDDRRGGRDSRGGGRSHSQRAGSGRDNRRTGAQRPGFREERLEKKRNEPVLPADLTIDDLDPSIIQDLKSLSKDNADTVAKHLIMAATLMEDDPDLALRHARAAKDRAGRVSVVRETLGIAAYRAGDWKEALAELRAARRMSGGPGLLAVIADCERGLGRPEKAIEIGRSDEATALTPADRVELAIVVAGARRDLGDTDGAVVELAAVGPSEKTSGLTAARLNYSYADALAAADRTEEAITWFRHAAEADIDGLLDSDERIAALTNL